VSPRVKCLWKRKMKTLCVVIIFRCKRPSCLPNEYNKLLNPLLCFYCLCYYTHFVYHMCETRSWHTYEMHLVSLRKSGVTLPKRSETTTSCGLDPSLTRHPTRGSGTNESCGPKRSSVSTRDSLCV
jgi:hypothetical protein